MSGEIGDALRRAREEQGRTVEEAARSLRVRSEYVEALEEEAFEVFGADTYARGHLRNYAKFLGLDPDELSAAYASAHGTVDETTRNIAASPVSQRPREPAPAWAVWTGVVVVVLVAIVLVGQVFGGRTPEAVDVDDLGRPTVSETPTVSPSPTPTPSPSPTVVYDGVNLLLAFEADSWLEVTVDGTRIVPGEVVGAGETRLYEADGEVKVRFGNAGGVIVEFNGQNLGPAGASGQVVSITFTPDGPVDEG